MTEHQLQSACSKCGKKYGLVEDSGLCLTCYKANPKKNKYNAKRTEYNGWQYDSKKEANQAEIFDRLIVVGQVKYYLEQVPFKLPGHIKYFVDFQVFWSNEEVIYYDVKGFITPVSRNKIKQVEEIYGIKIEII